MDVIVGLTGKGYAMVLADCSANRSIFALKHSEDKITKLDSTKILASAGEQSSRVEFSEFIAKNFALYRLKNGVELSNTAAANYIRHQIAEALRTRGAYQVNSIYAGVDSQGPEMYYCDYFGSLQKVNFTAHGYASYFALSVLDRNWKKDMTIEEGVAAMTKVKEQLKTRFIINLPNFVLKIVTADGVEVREF